MFKIIAVFTLLTVAYAAPGFVTETHHAVVQPAALLTKTAIVDTRASSAITHQSFTNLEKKVPILATYSSAPIVKTVSAPVVHAYAAAAPIVKSVATPIVHTYAAAPVVKTLTTPVVHSYAAATPVVHSVPVIHSAPVIKTVVSSPVAYHAIH